MVFGNLFVYDIVLVNSSSAAFYTYFLMSLILTLHVWLVHVLVYATVFFAFHEGIVPGIPALMVFWSDATVLALDGSTPS
jgi:hypothetical protein